MLSILALALSFSLNASAQTTDLYFAEGRLIAQIEWIQGPAVGTESKLQIRFVDGASGTPIQAPPVRVVLWMPDHNHGSSPTTTELMAGDGSQVQVSKMYFVMPGRWDVRIQLTLADKNQETQTLNVVLKGQHGHGHRH